MKIPLVIVCIILAFCFGCLLGVGVLQQFPVLFAQLTPTATSTESLISSFCNNVYNAPTNPPDYYHCEQDYFGHGITFFDFGDPAPQPTSTPEANGIYSCPNGDAPINRNEGIPDDCILIKTLPAQVKTWNCEVFSNNWPTGGSFDGVTVTTTPPQTPQDLGYSDCTLQ